MLWRENMSMTKSIATFLDNLCKEEGDDGSRVLTSCTRRAILAFVRENYGGAAQEYVASCFDDLGEGEGYLAHTLPGEALLDWMDRPLHVAGGNGGFRG